MGEQSIENDFDETKHKNLEHKPIKRENKINSTGKWKSKIGHTKSKRIDQIDKVEQLCRVCAEQAAGYHYGVFTCEGCKSFFGRYQKGKRKPPQECMNGRGQCDVKSRARNRCRYCRYQKCVAAGMSKSASRYGRRSNWFKVHCLSESQEDMKEDIKVTPFHSHIPPAPINDDQQGLLKKSSNFLQQHSSPSQISVIVHSPTMVVNPKPVRAFSTSPTNPMAIVQSQLQLTQMNTVPIPMDRGRLGSFPGHLLTSNPSVSLIPSYHQQSIFLSSTPATSAFQPVSYLSTGQRFYPAFFHSSLFSSSEGPLVEPLQNEPLDLSIRKSRF